MTQNRTHTCGELRGSNAGECVQLCGWMENLREVSGSLAFLVLRDFYGTTQVVLESEAMLQKVAGLNKESVLCVHGTVRERSSKNPNMPPVRWKWYRMPLKYWAAAGITRCLSRLTTARRPTSPCG